MVVTCFLFLFYLVLSTCWVPSWRCSWGLLSPSDRRRCPTTQICHERLASESSCCGQHHPSAIEPHARGPRSTIQNYSNMNDWPQVAWTRAPKDGLLAPRIRKRPCRDHVQLTSVLRGGERGVARVANFWRKEWRLLLTVKNPENSADVICTWILK